MTIFFIVETILNIFNKGFLKEIIMGIVKDISDMDNFDLNKKNFPQEEV
jgi:hypothetical protein